MTVVKTLRRLYQLGRRLFIRIARLRFYLFDMWRVARFMTLWPLGTPREEHLASKLFFTYHKLEKGLSMPKPYRLFGVPVVDDVMSLTTDWEKLNYALEAPAYLGGLAALDGYLTRVESDNLDPGDLVSSRLRHFLNSRSASIQTSCSTPVRLTSTEVADAACLSEFERLVEVRRSYRDFSTQPVEDPVVVKAVKLAQMSPSVCNRQSARVYAISDPAAKAKALSYQNGNRGFGETAAQVLVVTSDMRAFTDAAERNQPYVDGGLFSMSLVYAFQAQGIMSCCLNWCATESVDRAFRREFAIPEYERIIMFMAIGYPREHAFVPKSHRRATETILTIDFGAVGERRPAVVGNSGQVPA